MPLAVIVAGANRNDMKLAEATLESIMIARPIPPRSSRSTCVWMLAMITMPSMRR